MFCAAVSGHANVVETLVRLGSTALDQPNSSGYTPLYGAAHAGHVDVIETLVRLGSTALDKPDNDGGTPLYVAAYYGRAAVIETLVRLGSKAINTAKGDTPLIAATKRGHLDTVRLLLRMGADRTENASPRTAFSYAATADMRELFVSIPIGCIDWWQAELSEHYQAVRLLQRQFDNERQAAAKQHQDREAERLEQAAQLAALRQQFDDERQAAAKQLQDREAERLEQAAQLATLRQQLDDERQAAAKLVKVGKAKRLEQAAQPSEMRQQLAPAEAQYGSVAELSITVTTSQENALGTGSHGSVYKVRLADGRWAAAKTLHMFALPELYQLFPGRPEFALAVGEIVREVRMLAAAHHPNIVSLLGVVPHENYRLPDGTGVPEWIVTELADDTLEQRIRRTRLTLHQCRSIGVDVLSALAFVHHRGMLHRDLKPGNVLLFGQADATAKLCDFGVARFLESRTQTMTLTGTPAYRAPEVASSRYGQQVDVYSFGIMFVEMLTGSVPELLSAADLRRDLIRQQLAELQLLPPVLNELLVSAVHPEPSQRCTVARLLKALIDFVPASSSSSSSPAFDVRTWLNGVHASLARYGDAFVAHSFDEPGFLKSLTEQDLKEELGVTALAHRRLIMQAIGNL